MKIGINNFVGRVPGTDSRSLPNQFANVATDCVLSSTSLLPRHADSIVWSVDRTTLVRSAYLLARQLWLTWGSLVQVARTLLSDQQDSRIYYAGDGPHLRATNLTLAQAGTGFVPRQFRRVGVQAPTAAPTAALGSGSGGVSVAHAYVETWVNDWNEEGPPSPVSNVLTRPTGQSVVLTLGVIPPQGDFAPITRRRIYRTLSGSTMATFNFMVEVPASTTSHTEAVPDANLGEAIRSRDWFPPPAVSGVVAHPNNFMVTFSGREIYPSDFNIPYGYPPPWALKTEHDIVSIRAVGNSIVVITQGPPYIVTGSDPGQLSIRRLPYGYACVSAAGVVLLRQGVVYPSSEGLVLIDEEGRAQVVTEALMSEREWESFRPEMIVGGSKGAKYFGFVETGLMAGRQFTGESGDGPVGGAAFGILPHGSSTTFTGFTESVRTGFSFSIDMENLERGLVDSAAHGTAVFSDTEADQMYYVAQDFGFNLIKLHEGSQDRLIPYEWESKEYITPPISLTAAKAFGDYRGVGAITTLGDDGPFARSRFGSVPFGLMTQTVTVNAAETSVMEYFGDGQLVASAGLTSDGFFRMPAGRRYRRHRFRFKGTAVIQDFRAAESVAELRD